MGLGIISVVAMSAWIGVLVLRSSEGGFHRPAARVWARCRQDPGASPVLHDPADRPWVGGVANDAPGCCFGWSRTGGDLRVAHFVGLHAMQGYRSSGISSATCPRGARSCGLRSWSGPWSGCLVHSGARRTAVLAALNSTST